MAHVTARTARCPRSAAGAAADLVDALRPASGDVVFDIDGRSHTVPADLIATLVDLFDDVAEGRDVVPAPANLPIGTELASGLLGVSRPWLTKLLDRGDIPSERVGSKRRIRLRDLLAYRRADDARRASKLAWEFLNEE